MILDTSRITFAQFPHFNSWASKRNSRVCSRTKTCRLLQWVVLDKKGIVAQQLVILVLVMFFLVLMIMLFTRAQTGHWIPDFIPEFNQTGTGRTELALVRYVISEDRVDYYDGANWRAFGDMARQFNAETTADNTYNGAVLKQEIRAHYFDLRGQLRKAENVEFYDLFDGYYIRISEVIAQSYDAPQSWWESRLTQDVVNYLSGAVRPLQRGDVMLELWKHGGTGEAGQLQAIYVLRGIAGEILRISRRGSDFFDEKVAARELVRRKALAWRESVLQQPMRVTYKLESGEEQISYVCMKRTTGTEDLVARLDRNVEVNSRCEGA